MRATAEPSSPVIASPTVTVDVGAFGIYTLSLTAAETLSMPVEGTTISSTTAYLYDVFMTKTVSTIKQTAGTITVVPAVTRS